MDNSHKSPAAACSGGRIHTLQHQNRLEIARNFAQNPKPTRRFEILRLLNLEAQGLGLSRAERTYLFFLVDKTQDRNWSDGTPIVWRSVASPPREQEKREKERPSTLRQVVLSPTMTPEEEKTAAQEILTPERLAVLLLDDQAPETWNELLAAVNARVQTQAEDLSERTWQLALEKLGVLRALLCLGLALYKHREGRARSPGAYLYGLMRRLRWARKEGWITRWKTMRGINSRSNERRHSLQAMRNADGNALWSASNKRIRRNELNAPPRLRQGSPQPRWRRSLAEGEGQAGLTRVRSFSRLAGVGRRWPAQRRTLTCVYSLFCCCRL